MVYGRQVQLQTPHGEDASTRLPITLPNASHSFTLTPSLRNTCENDHGKEKVFLRREWPENESDLAKGVG